MQQNKNSLYLLLRPSGTAVLSLGTFLLLFPASSNLVFFHSFIPLIYSLDRKAYFNSLADEAQLGILHNNLRSAYRAIGFMSGKRRNNDSIPVLKLDGSPCSSAEEILSRWQEHFVSVLNFAPAAPCSQLESQVISYSLNTIKLNQSIH